MQSGDNPKPPALASAFDEAKLRRDLLSVIARATDDQEFLGHDGRRYKIAKDDVEEPESEIFVSVFAKFDQGDALVGRYAVMVQKISR